MRAFVVWGLPRCDPGGCDRTALSLGGRHWLHAGCCMQGARALALCTHTSHALHSKTPPFPAPGLLQAQEEGGGQAQARDRGVGACVSAQQQQGTHLPGNPPTCLPPHCPPPDHPLTLSPPHPLPNHAPPHQPLHKHIHPPCSYNLQAGLGVLAGLEGWQGTQGATLLLPVAAFTGLLAVFLTLQAQRIRCAGRLQLGVSPTCSPGGRFLLHECVQSIAPLPLLPLPHSPLWGSTCFHCRSM